MLDHLYNLAAPIGDGIGHLWPIGMFLVVVFGILRYLIKRLLDASVDKVEAIIDAKIAPLDAQLHPNGGGSFRDAIDTANKKIDGLDVKLDESVATWQEHTESDLLNFAHIASTLLTLVHGQADAKDTAAVNAGHAVTAAHKADDAAETQAVLTRQGTADLLSGQAGARETAVATATTAARVASEQANVRLDTADLLSDTADILDGQAVVVAKVDDVSNKLTKSD